LKNGSCHYGSACKFSHVEGAKARQGEHEPAKKLPELIEEEKKRCVNCDEDAALENVIECTNPKGPHFYCLECFQGGYADNQLSAEYRTQFVDHGFRFTCRWCELDEPDLIFLKGTELEILSLVGDDGLVKYMKVREEIAHIQAAEETEDRIRRQFENEKEQAKLTKGRVDNHRLFIADNILTLQCPRCKQPILDFYGCFAVTHGKDLNGCGCSFCAWCLADCGNDAHAHVRNCGLNPKPGSLGFMSNPDDAANLKRVQNSRTRTALEKYFSESVLEQDRGMLANEIEIDLRDLGIMPLDLDNLGVAERKSEV